MNHVNDNQELEELFSFTAPSIEIESNFDSFNTGGASNEFDNLKIEGNSSSYEVDFDISRRMKSASFSGIIIDRVDNTWDSLNPFPSKISVDLSRASSAQPSIVLSKPISTQFSFQRDSSFDEDTRELLEWLEKTEKPSKPYLEKIDTGEVDVFKRLSNEVHQIFQDLTKRLDDDLTTQRPRNKQRDMIPLEEDHSSNINDPSDSQADVQQNNQRQSHEIDESTLHYNGGVIGYMTTSLSHILRSTDSTISKDIRPLLMDAQQNISQQTLNIIQPQDRPYLWTKILCSNKTMEDVQKSSLVDSFISWHQGFNFQAFSEWCKKVEDVQTATESPYGLNHCISRCILQEATTLAKYIITLGLERCSVDSTYPILEKQSTTIDEIYQNLSSLLVFYYQKENLNKKVIGMDTWNQLLGSVAATLLSALIPIEIVSVMISTIGPIAMPLLLLTKEERKIAAETLHTYFYQLVLYHCPILTLHLDRNIPKWYLPTESSSEQKNVSSDDNHKNIVLEQGLIPITWFASLLAGECFANQLPKTLAMKHLHQYWDFVFISQDNSLKFFLALALLEAHSDTLLTLQGAELIEEFTNIMTFQDTAFTENNELSMDSHSLLNSLLTEAKVLQESTPSTFLTLLIEAENDVVNRAIVLRQKQIVEKEEKEDADRRKQIESERLQKEEESLNRSYLISFYEKHAPDKLSTVDNILQVYSGRVPLLDQRLKAKYGVGFLPVLGPKTVTSTTIKALKQSIQQGLMGINERDSKKLTSTDPEEPIKLICPSNDTCAISVSSSDVLTTLFGSELSSLSLSCQQQKSRCNYCIIDSRPDDVASTQGRFRGSISLSPEILDSPTRTNELRINRLEKLRGDHHLCIMGAGISALSNIYGLGPSWKAEDHGVLDQGSDEFRTKACALFLINEGFPFVSIMDGGFAAAYSWIRRHNPQIELMVLSDIDRSVSSYVELENNYEELIAETTSTSRSVQKMFDRSLAVLTLGEQKIEASLSKFFVHRGDGSSKKE